MKAFILNKLDKVKKYAHTDLQKDKLTQSPWILFDPEAEVKTTYFFKEDGRLIMSVGGNVEIGKWEILGKSEILISHSQKHFLLYHKFFFKEILLFTFEGNPGYIVFLNKIKLENRIRVLLELEHYLEELFDNLGNGEKEELTGSKIIKPKLSLTEKNFKSHCKIVSRRKGNLKGWGICEEIRFESTNDQYFKVYYSKRKNCYLFRDQQMRLEKFETLEDAAIKSYNSLFDD